ncbi:MAG TPA: hypothetical protein VM100_07135 [Longimicrobiales bacterium]|nr:hypothetical protein [Longimicrobiales bacterium]
MEQSRRREHLVERALSAGHSRELADLIYDVAEEEKVDAALVFDVVLAGLGVRDLAEPVGTEGETVVEAAPQWLEPPGEKGEADRERHVRNTVRRIRHLMEESSSTEDAIDRFHREPDVGKVDY